jgi:PDZ domain-containing protein
MIKRAFGMRFWRTPLIFGPSWLVIAPLTVLATVTYYVPVFGPFLAEDGVWAVAIGAVVLMAASVVIHGLAHLAAARASGSDLPERVPLYPLGDAAQSWPAAPTPWREALTGLAGPAANAALALLTYLLWDRHLHPFLNAGLPLVILFNVLLAVINLVPGFPLDGGRLARALVWGLLARPDRATPVGRWLGGLAVAGLTVWGVGLLVQPARFHIEAGAGTLVIAGLVGLALRQPAGRLDALRSLRLPAWALLRRTALTSGLLLGLFLPPAALLPTLNGLYAPGYAVPVEPMVMVDPAYRHQHEGSFLLTSVVAQTPILAGQWVQGQLDPTVAIVPPERIVPPDTTPRQLMARSYSQLEDSTLIASVVALRLAGYTPRLTGDGAVIAGILPESPSAGLLRTGDRVVALDGAPVGTAGDLIAALRAQTGRTAVTAAIERDGRRHELTLPLMPPARPGAPPRLGVSVETAGLRTDLPFEVKIEPVKIVGGPSAGLMFALTLYNLLSAEDLTGGQRIAGTGTLSLDGAVGPIGGVPQKVAGAEQAGATLFFTPRANYEEARRAARHITVVPVGTIEEAIDFLRHRAAQR